MSKSQVFMCSRYFSLQKLNDVLEFLKLPKMELTSRHVKIHTGPLSEHIKNWDEINKTLKGTEYESFLRTDYKR